MKYKIQKAIFIALILVSSIGTKSQDSLTNNTLHRLFEDYYEDRLKLFPLEATSIGDDRYNNILPNNGSAPYIKQLHDFDSKYQSYLNKYKPQSLNAEDRISWYILKDIIGRDIEAEQYHIERMPFAQVFSLPLAMGQLGSGKGDQPFKTV